MAKEIDPDVARFAAYVREQEQREKASKRAEREARQQADATQALVRAKDAAAAEVKRLRSREGVSTEERAAADAAYREALAAVVAAETGAAPAWAPPPSEAELGGADGDDAGDAEATDTEGPATEGPEAEESSGDDGPAPDGEVEES